MSRKNAQKIVPAEGGTAHRLGQVEAYFTVRESCPRRVQPKMAFYRASAAVFTGVGIASLGLSAVNECPPGNFVSGCHSEESRRRLTTKNLIMLDQQRFFAEPVLPVPGIAPGSLPKGSE
jgi:hypothetical protein